MPGPSVSFQAREAQEVGFCESPLDASTWVSTALRQDHKLPQPSCQPWARGVLCGAGPGTVQAPVHGRGQDSCVALLHRH